MRRFLSIFGRPGLNRQGLATGTLFVAGAALVALSVTPIAAQVLPPQMHQMLGQRGQSGATTAFPPRDSASDTGTVLIQPAAVPSRPQPRSLLEQILSSRAGVPLNQFGYSDLGSGRSVLLPQSGGVQDSYIMGPGDEVLVTLRGQEAGEYRMFVDRNGRLMLPKLSPINVAGRTFGEFQQDLASAVQRAYVATQAFASLGTVRQIRVTVAGEVNNPGLRLMTGLASALDAIQVSSGVKKTGSLRNIVIQRGGARIRVDLYGVLRGTGGTQIPLLTDGDRVLVSSLGPTVAIVGAVRIPAIYELAPGQSGMTAASLVALAGGYAIRGRYDLALIGLSADGRTQLSNLPNDRALVRDSDVLIVRSTAEQTVGRATLQAGSANGFSGTYTAQATRLSAMLRAPGVLGDDPYPLFAVVSRRDPVSLLRSLIAVTPSAVMAGRQDLSLQSDDIVHTFTRAEAVELIRAISWFDERRQRLNEKVQTPGATPLLGRPEELPPRQNRQNTGDTFNPDGTPADGANALGGIQNGASGGYQGTGGQNGYGNNANGFNNAGGVNDSDTYTSTESYNDNSGYYDGYAYDTATGGATGLNAGMAGGAVGDATGSAGNAGADPQANNTNGTAGVSTGGLTGAAAANALRNRRIAGPDPTARYRRELDRVSRLAEALKVEPAIIANFVQEHMVVLTGAVRGAGTYIVGPDLPLSTLVQAAGGTVNWSDKTGVERVSTIVDGLTGQSRTTTQTLDINQSQFATMVVRPGDQFRFPEASVTLAGTITLKGEVRRPGIYNIVRGERLSDVLVRAGGLTHVAYPYGAVFLRKSVAARERDGFQRAARDLESQLTSSLTRTTAANQYSNPALNYVAIRALVNDLRSQQALGRVSVIADPAILATRPQVDPLLEEGDVLYIPQRPTTVTVLGEVMNSTSFPSEANVSVAEYINRAGGYGRYADESLTFVVLPDGTARQADKSWFSLGGDSIPPGSTIVVPKDVNPLQWRQLLVDGTQILSQLAIAAASLAVLNK